MSKIITSSSRYNTSFVADLGDNVVKVTHARKLDKVPNPGSRFTKDQSRIASLLSSVSDFADESRKQYKSIKR